MADIKYYDVILKPVITERSMAGMGEKKYTFLVHPQATKTQIKEWLDMQIGIMYAQSQKLVLTEKKDILNENTTPDIILRNISAMRYVHIGNEALRFVAKVMDLPIAVIEREDESFRYELEFWYNGVKFVALESEREYKNNGELA